MSATESPIQYPFDRLPAPGEALAVAPGIEWLRMPLPFALDHINLWLLQDGGGTCAAVDSGFALDEIRAAWRTVLATRVLSRCIITHCHPDHLGLADWLRLETDAGMWITQGEYLAAWMIREQLGSYSIPSMLDFFRRHGLGDEGIEGLRQRGNGYARGVPSLPPTYTRLYAGDELDIGGRSWRVIVGHGHSPEHASLYCAEAGVLISGDMLLPRISTNIPVLASVPQGDPLGRFLASLDALRALPADTLVLPSHGKPFRGLHARIDELFAHHAARCRDLLAAAGQPVTAAEMIPVLFSRPIDDPHQTMFAMGEAIAHLNYLLHAGRLRGSETDGLVRYVKTP